MLLHRAEQDVPHVACKTGSAALHIWQCKAKLQNQSHFWFFPAWLYKGSNDAWQHNTAWTDFLLTYICKGQQAEDRRCSDQERHQHLQAMQTDLSGCKGGGFCGAGLPACAALQRRFCAPAAAVVPPPQSSGQGLCAPSWPGPGRSFAGWGDAVQLACKPRRTSSHFCSIASSLGHGASCNSSDLLACKHRCMLRARKPSWWEFCSEKSLRSRCW